MNTLLKSGLAAIIALSGSVSSAQDTATTTPATVSIIDQWAADHMLVFDAADVTLDDLLWTARPLVIFADSPNDPRLQQQLELLAERPEDLALRDVILIVDTDPAAMSDLRTTLRPRGFMLALVSKDGRVAFRKPAPWSVREISRSIDKMPLRQQEINDRREVTQ